MDVSGDSMLLRLKGYSVEETKGIAKMGRVKLEEIEEAPGREM